MSTRAMSSAESENRTGAPAFIAAVVVGLALLWAYWPMLLRMAEQWESSPEYSHGWLVPLFALALLWMRRPQDDATGITKLGVGGGALLFAGLCLGFVAPAGFAWAAAALGVAGAAVLWCDWSSRDRRRPDWLGGGILLIGGVAFQLIAAHFYLEWFERLALLPVLAGTVLLLAGRRTMRWSWPAIGFLFFMIPLPYTLEVALRGPLRDLGTDVSTYVIQTTGIPAFAEGNVIVVPRPDGEEVRIGVVEACSGLRMLMIFFALSAAVALIVDRPFWQRALILGGAVPIALISNIGRITVTAICEVQGWEHLAELTFHDMAGWMMMPLGLALLWCELWFLDHLFIVEEDRPLATGLTGQRDISSPRDVGRVAETVGS